MKKITVLVLVSSFFYVSAISDLYAKDQYTTFQHENNSIHAFYKTPDTSTTPKGVVIFVHGDGAMSYDADGYYDPIWRVFNDNGYAVFSWDKPGVGHSTGNWLKQSMLDRQNEVRAAISHVKKAYGYKDGDIGLMGFSQAGWVIPDVVRNNTDIAFMIGIGFAINWLDQSWYLTKIRLMKDGASNIEIQKAHNKHIEEREFWKNQPTYNQYLQKFGTNGEAMSKERFEFVQKNVLSDSKVSYRGITQPTLILMGSHDKNVNSKNTYAVLSHIFNARNNAHIKIIPNATHAMLKHSEFGDLELGLQFWLKLMWQGEKAYAPELFEQLTSWTNKLAP